jgi:hypothetical protein
VAPWSSVVAGMPSRGALGVMDWRVVPSGGSMACREMGWLHGVAATRLAWGRPIPGGLHGVGSMGQGRLRVPRMFPGTLCVPECFLRDR